ncbi:hypothetical protein PBI_TRISCUIT_16 [Microbacterium phage Triscuit]|nr:hypothetical protein PBI_TRISCUIT_16 [Microbacterium phage Triscuit]
MVTRFNALVAVEISADGVCIQTISFDDTCNKEKKQ